MIPVIDPVPAAALAAEFAALPLLREFRGLQLYEFAADSCPRAMREIGRLREAAYRAAGAGRNLACDIDELDTVAHGYRQIAAWDPRHQQIVAMYRYQTGSTAAGAGDSTLRTSQLFQYSPHFRRKMLPCAIELGRSVVNQQAARRVLGLFAVWCGLGAILQQHPEVSYFFGNVSLYPGMHPAAQEYLITFLEHHYAPNEPLLLARPGLRRSPAASISAHSAPGDTPADRIAHLKQHLSALNEPIPPILQSYLRLGTGLWFGQTARDADFGDAHEIGIIVPLAGIEPTLKTRFGLGTA